MSACEARHSHICGWCRWETYFWIEDSSVQWDYGSLDHLVSFRYGSRLYFVATYHSRQDWSSLQPSERLLYNAIADALKYNSRAKVSTVWTMIHCASALHTCLRLVASVNGFSSAVLIDSWDINPLSAAIFLIQYLRQMQRIKKIECYNAKIFTDFVMQLKLLLQDWIMMWFACVLALTISLSDLCFAI